MISMLLPIASRAVNPNMRSAAGFHPVMTPSRVSVTIASLDDSTAAMKSCSRSKVRRRSSISRLSAAVLARDSAAMCANASASTLISWPPPVGNGFIAGKPLDDLGHLHQRPRQRAGDDDGQQECTKRRNESTHQAGVANRGGCRHECRIRHRLDHEDPGTIRQTLGHHTDPEARAGSILNHARRRIAGREYLGEFRKVVLDMKGLGKFEPELAIGVRMDEIITLVIDDIASTAFGGGRADPGKCGPHIDVDDHDP